MKVQAYFLGEPRLFLENREKMPGKNKLDALLFYLLYHETIDRNEAASVFWPEKDAVHAKASLRNSLYEIRQILGVDLFRASSRDRIIVAADMDLEKDVDRLLDEDRPIDLVSLSSYVFMQNRELKDNEGYETWLTSMREAYQAIISNTLIAKLNQAREKGSSQEVQIIAQRLLVLEPYSETALRSLMQSLADLYRYNDALAIYLRFKKSLKNDLEVEPEAETVKLADFIQQRKKQLEETPRETFERSGLLLKMKDALQDFLENNGTRHILIYGDPGSGRSALIESFMRSGRIPFVMLELDYSNKTIPEGFLTKWARQFMGTDQEDFRRILFNLPQEPILVILRNAENMDPQSLPYFQDFLSSVQHKILFLLEAATDFIRGDSAFALSAMNSELAKIEVPLLTLPELRDYLSSYSITAGHPFSEDEVNRIFDYSGGNLLLANEYIRPQGLKEGLFTRITAGLSREEKKLLEAFSVYNTGFTPKMAVVHTAEPVLLMDNLRSLVSRGLLIETGGVLKIKYSPLREWLYDKLPDFYRKHLHELAAQNGEDLKLSERLDSRFRAWHWKKAGNIGKALFYRLKEVELTLDFYDQLYPSFVELEDVPDDFTQSRKKYYAMLDELAAEVDRFSENTPSEEASSMEMIIRYLRGRLLIAGGSRDLGIEEIGAAVRLARELGNLEYLFKGRMEGIHYSIQKEDMPGMSKYIALAQELIDQPKLGSNQRKRADLFRLEGLYFYYMKRYPDALVRLKEAEEILRDSRYRKNGFLARAGALNYMGWTKEAMRDFSGADEAYNASIALVEGKVHKCLDIIYADYGEFLWQVKRIPEAKAVLTRSLEEYDLLGTHWKRPATEAILGLIALEEKNFRAARSHLVNAQIYHKADRRSGEEKLITRLAEGLAVREKPALPDLKRQLGKGGLPGMN